jgi:hypothetical protein
MREAGDLTLFALLLALRGLVAGDEIVAVVWNT